MIVIDHRISMLIVAAVTAAVVGYRDDLFGPGVERARCTRAQASANA